MVIYKCAPPPSPPPKKKQSNIADYIIDDNKLKQYCIIYNYNQQQTSKTR